mgnify:CR=1 FL=1
MLEWFKQMMCGRKGHRWSEWFSPKYYKAYRYCHKCGKVNKSERD